MSYNNPSSDGVFIKGKRGRLFAQYYLPGGEYPKPVVMLCHGIPGNERLFDFAVYLRQQGFCTISFHYSGNWGSDGEYSIHNCIEDCQSVIDYIKKNENGWFDLDNVFVVGHSLGGLMSTITTATQDIVKAGVIIMPMNGEVNARAVGGDETEMKAVFDSFGEWLVDFGWDKFKRELEDDENFAHRISLKSYAESLAEKDVLTIRGNLDTALPREENIDVLNNAIKSYGKGKLVEKAFDCDHGMNMQRDEIKEAIAQFLKSKIK